MMRLSPTCSSRLIPDGTSRFQHCASLSLVASLLSVLLFVTQARADGVLCVGRDLLGSFDMQPVGLASGLDDIEVIGGYAYCVQNRELAILDVSDPSEIAFVGSVVVESNNSQIEVVGDIGYLRGSNELRIVDLSDRANPVVVGLFVNSGTNYKVLIDGTTAYMLNTEAGLQVIDVSDPSAPSLLGEAYFEINYFSDMTTADSIVYVSHTDGLQVIDASDPQSPLIVSSPEPILRGRVEARGELLYVVHSENLEIYDYSDLSIPILLAECQIGPFGPSYIQIEGNTLFVASENNNAVVVESVNIQNPSNPSSRGSQRVNSDAPSGGVYSIYDGVCYFSNEARDNLDVVQLREIASPIFLGSYEMLDYAQDFAVENGIAYIADGTAGLKIVDVSDPSNPILQGVLNEYASSVAVSGDTAFLLGGNTKSILLVDVENPADPVVISTMLTQHFGEIFVNDDRVYVTGGHSNVEGIAVIDISDPLSPFQTDIIGSRDYIDVAFSGTWLAASGDGIGIFDLDDPHSPLSLEGNRDRGGWSRAVDFSGTRFFAASGNALDSYVMDSMSGPSYNSSFRFDDDWANAVVLDGTTAYYGGGKHLRIVDVSDASSMSQILSIDLPGAVYDLQVVDTKIYTLYYDYSDGKYYYGMVIHDVGDLPSPPLLSTFDPAAMARQVTVHNELAYIGTSRDLAILDVSDPAQPAFLGTYGTSGSRYELEIIGSKGFLAAGSLGLEILGFADPSQPERISLTDTPGIARAVEINNGKAYVADGEFGLQIIDIEDLSEPYILGTFDTPDMAEDLSVVEDTVYVADNESGLLIIDASDPMAPIQIGSYKPNSAQNVNAVEVVGDTAYIGGRGLHIVDVSDPTNPQLLSIADLTYYTAYSLMIVDDRAYIANGPGGLSVVDVSNPYEPVQIASYFMPTYARSIWTDGTTAYSTEPEYGLRIVDVSDCTDCLPIDLTGDGILDVFDVFAFIDLFSANDPAADFTGDGLLDVFDIFVFLAEFELGCP